MDDVKEKTNGQVVIEFLGGPEVVSPFQALEPVGNGVYDMLYSTPSYYSGTIKAGTALNNGYGPLPEIRKTGAIDLMADLFRDIGNVETLPYFESGSQTTIMTKKPIHSLKDFQGIKMRGISIWKKFIPALGMSMVSVSSAETYEALERGVADGALYPVMRPMVELGWHEVLSCAVFPQHPGQFYGPVFMNLDRWNELPENLQKILWDTGIAIENQVWDFYHDDNRRVLGMLIEQYGWQTTWLPKEEREQYLRTYIDSQWDTVVEDDPVNGPKFRDMLMPTQEAFMQTMLKVR